MSEYHDTDAREKDTKIFVEQSSTGAVFSINISMEEIDLVMAEN